jgi:hypothetical protein
MAPFFDSSNTMRGERPDSSRSRRPLIVPPDGGEQACNAFGQLHF